MKLTDNNYVIEAKGLSKYFGAITALENVDFELRKGEVLGLVGDNAAGKSTLIKILSGSITPNKGSIKVYGKEVKINNPRDAFDLGIETIYQDLALFDNLNFTQNIFAGREYVTKDFGKILRFADNRRMRVEAMNKIKNISINLPKLSQKTETLSGGQRQSVAITRAIFWGRRIIIMDEPTAALGVEESKKVLNMVNEIRNNLDGMIVITHNIEQIIKIVDRVIVLRNGCRVGSIDFKFYKGKSEELHNDIVKLITGVELVAS